MLGILTLPVHVPTRSQIEELEQMMLRQPQINIEPVHHFSEGLYAREITIPAGAVVTGKVHKQEHINIVSKGAITVWTEDGMKYIAAPFTFVSRPGTKRAGYTHEETVWTTVHANPTNERDIPKIEELFVEPANLQIKEAAQCLS